MSISQPFRRPTDLPLALAAAAVATAQAWRMGWLRDDWLMLWQALDPATAPAGAAGVFPRPVAAQLWGLAAALSGDDPWGMHLLAAAAWCALVLGALRWHRAFGGRGAGAAVVALGLSLHGALVEPRLWAAAGNGVLAAALAVWGAWLWQARTRWPGRALGSALVAAAMLARADALVLLVLPLAARSGGERGRGRPLTALALLGLAALAVMVARGGGWALRPGDAGQLLRLMVLPWGPPLGGTPAAVLGVCGVLAALAGGLLLLTAAPRAAAFLLSAAAVAAAGAVVDWTPAGRYVMMPAVVLALALGAWWDGIGRTDWSLSARRILRGGIVGWIALSAAAAFAGRTAADLQRLSAVETGLYRALRAELPLPGDHLTLLNAPPLGWTGSAADAENVVSAAARRPMVVSLGPDRPHGADFPVAVWRHGAWTVWTGRAPGDAVPESR